MVLEIKFTFLIQKCACLIKVRISQSSHWWEQAILGSQDNTYITKIQSGSLTRKGIAMCFFLQTTNYRLCSDSEYGSLYLLQNFSTCYSKHSYQSLTPAVDPQLSLLKHTKFYQLYHPKQDNYQEIEIRLNEILQHWRPLRAFVWLGDQGDEGRSETCLWISLWSFNPTISSFFHSCFLCLV